MQTTFTKTGEAAPTWYVVSAKNVVLGQLAVRIAKVLQGKHKASFTPNVDDGDVVIVTDAKDVVLTGRKDTQKVYRYHTGFVGGLKEVPFRRMRDEHPDQVIALAVRRMLPKTRLARQMMSKLKVYPGSEHPHLAQKPAPLPNL
ncbi:MAG: 50S ribosomal protein L13 [Planctomycetota bacterium]|nr:MAG: 50S ribosomal protein L13 [Planctomycetota bacterium]